MPAIFYQTHLRLGTRAKKKISYVSLNINFLSVHTATITSAKRSANSSFISHLSSFKMTLERFSRIVDDPDLLRTITYEELKTLALAYPYAHNLRYLLAIKASQTEHQDVVKNIATAAAYSIDRMQLFRLVAPQMIAPQEAWVAEEVLELKPIETIKRKLEDELHTIDTVEKQVEGSLEAALEHPAEQRATEDVRQNQELTPETGGIEDTDLPQIPYQSFSDWIGCFRPQVLDAMVSDVVEEPVKVLPNSAPIEQLVDPKTTDNQYFEEEDALETEDAPVEESTKSQGIAQILAEKSVAENKDVISETLAKLYAKQGYRDKAIAMYERLGLAFPEKSPYFAAEIDKLKK